MAVTHGHHATVGRMTGSFPRPRKRFGQNFLTDRNVLNRIVEAAGILPGEPVLEIGPGRGALTRLLAVKAGKVVAVEVDRDLVELLTAEFAADEQVEIISADVLECDLPRLLADRHPGPWRVVANLPYNISSQVLFLLLDHMLLFSGLTLMLQKEVAERIACGPDEKEYGILSVFCQLHCEVSLAFTVKPGSFTPAPKVHSAILHLDPLPAPRCDVGDEAYFRRLVKAAFGNRRKTLWNCLKGQFAASDDNLRLALDACSIDPGRRGETLTLEEFAMLSRTLQV
jgi:16S rRNA (adenine1518-N6/adenine1519-N6)-dimethyltransferase